MEAGDYDFLVGTSSRDVTLAARLTLDKTVETEHLTNICPLLDALKEIQPEEEKEERWRAEREQMWEEKKSRNPAAVPGRKRSDPRWKECRRNV